MDVRIESLIEGGRRVLGLVWTVDVFRVFTTAVAAFARGADRIVIVPDIDEAL